MPSRPIYSSSMPKSIAEALIGVSSRVRRLTREERNQHAGYNFAGIDTFLEEIGPLCAAAGLFILQDEYDVELIERPGPKGPVTWLKVIYAMGLGSVTGELWQDTLARTVFVRMDGPQATGAAQSYALKQFMRSLFLIPTGDREDADLAPKDFSPEEVPAKPRANGAPAEPVSPVSASAHIAMHRDPAGNPLAGRWTKQAMEVLDRLRDKAERRLFLEVHRDELKVVHDINPLWASRIVDIAEG